jgi:hypothetical protein
MENFDNALAEKPIIVPTKEHTLLEAFIGNWAVEGENFVVGPNEAQTDVKGIETYEWLNGGFFMVYKWDRYFGTESHKGIGIISHDELEHTFQINNYDNMGYAKSYRITYQHETWSFAGENERATIQFGPDGNSFSEKWEVCQQKTWKTLCLLTGKRIS